MKLKSVDTQLHIHLSTSGSTAYWSNPENVHNVLLFSLHIDCVAILTRNPSVHIIHT